MRPLKGPSRSGSTVPIVLHAASNPLDPAAVRAFDPDGFVEVVHDEATVVAALDPDTPALNGQLALILKPAYGVSGLAWRIRGWRFDPSPLNLWEDYRLDDERHVRERVIANRRASLTHNKEELDRKLRWVKRAEKSLYVGFFYVAIVLLFQVARG